MTIFYFIFGQICHGLYLCVSGQTLRFVLYSRSSYLALFSSIAKLLKMKMVAKQPFLKCLVPKVNQIIA